MRRIGRRHYWNTRGLSTWASDDRGSAFTVVRSNGTDEVLARAMNLMIARGAYQVAARVYPEDPDRAAPSRARAIEKSR
jgi:hypothetical protein